MKITSEILLDYAEIHVYDNGIFHIHFIDKRKLTLDRVKEITEIRWRLCGNENGLVLSSTEDKFILPEDNAYNYLNSKERLKTIKAQVYVVKGLSQQVALKTAKLFHIFSVPTKGFKNVKEGVEWLLSYKKDFKTQESIKRSSFSEE